MPQAGKIVGPGDIGSPRPAQAEQGFADAVFFQRLGLFRKHYPPGIVFADVAVEQPDHHPRAPAEVLSEAARNRLEIERTIRDVQSEEHTSELQSHVNLVCRLLLEKKKNS